MTTHTALRAGRNSRRRLRNHVKKASNAAVAGFLYCLADLAQQIKQQIIGGELTPGAALSPLQNPPKKVRQRRKRLPRGNCATRGSTRQPRV